MYSYARGRRELQSPHVCDCARPNCDLKGIGDCRRASGLPRPYCKPFFGGRAAGRHRPVCAQVATPCRIPRSGVSPLCRLTIGITLLRFPRRGGEDGPSIQRHTRRRAVGQTSCDYAKMPDFGLPVNVIRQFIQDLAQAFNSGVKPAALWHVLYPEQDRLDYRPLIR